MELKIEYLSIEDLKPYERNNKIHEEFDIDEIAKSIQKHGMNDPIGIWGEDNIIVEGHGRLLACKKLGIEKVPCIRLDHMDDKGRREYAIVHNKSSELAKYDFGNLKLELAELNLDDFNFNFGIEDNEQEKEVVKERSEVALNENISIVIECADDEEAETIFLKLSEEGYKCRISTL